MFLNCIMCVYLNVGIFMQLQKVSLLQRFCWQRMQQSLKLVLKKWINWPRWLCRCGGKWIETYLKMKTSGTETYALESKEDSSTWFVWEQFSVSPFTKISRDMHNKNSQEQCLSAFPVNLKFEGPFDRNLCGSFFISQGQQKKLWFLTDWK